MRFRADMGVARDVVRWLREQGHDAVHLLGSRLAPGTVVIVEETRFRVRHTRAET